MQQQLDLFNAERWPRKPYCSNEKGAHFIRPLHVAMGHRYIQPNAPMLQFRLIFDIDRPLDPEEWALAGLAQPNWSASTPITGRPHLGYEIDVPVGIGPNHHTHPIRLLAAVEQQYLNGLNADKGYSGVVCKNPLHDDWNVFTYRREAYTLTELASHVDLKKYNDRRKLKEWEWYGVGRNYVTFEKLRRWAYGQVDEYRQRGNANGWREACRNKAEDYNTEFANWRVRRCDGKINSGPLPPRDMAAIARSVADWTWKWYWGKAESDRRFSATQAARGRMKGKSKRDELMPTVLELHAAGRSQSEIARELDVSRQNISNWLMVVKKP